MQFEGAEGAGHGTGRDGEGGTGHGTGHRGESGTGHGGRRVRAATAVAALLAVAAGVALPAAQAAQPQQHGPGAGPTEAPVGMWRMDGYGTVLAVAHNRVREYQTTDSGCLKGTSSKRVRGDAAARYKSADGQTFTLRREQGPWDRPTRHRTDQANRAHRAEGSGRAARADRASMHIDGSPGDRRLRRIEALPAACVRDVPDDPVHTFDVFWQTFEENYPFFEAKGVDWHAVREHWRPRIDSRTTPARLFAVFRKMVAPLHDAHVAVLAGDTGTFGRVRPGTEMPTPELDAKVRKFIEERDLRGGRLRQFAGGRIGYARLPGGRGYLRVSGFTGYTEDGSYEADRAELRRALDAVLTPERTARLKGLVLDLRVNGGGSDSLGLELAARLTGGPYFAYAKAARNDPADPGRFTRPQPSYVRPAPGRPRYTGPVAVLTGGSTLSAGETFTQALMERPGRTVRIGQHTQGVFSDTMERRLPNGWSFLLPNEEFRTRDGRTFDGKGIPPHISEPVFTHGEFEHDRDSAFDRAVAELREAG
ncbi:S41 family peptidase [Streptomyces sp. HNM0575]|uniref:S41 family peptidase n=1 Tax=Streptomyces sp. HNM0575 TaxID=2716338 RepID=UPI00145C8A8E|nr:S41 family peptidase [Streptomyces sp. HNM0575]NLU71498.1 S41 family peptidase [Streptomyces sp. HNM0575]